MTEIDFGAELLQILDPEGNESDYQLPPYGKPGHILVEVTNIAEALEKPKWEYEILDWDGDSGVFWIQEGIGFDYFLDNCCEFPAEGRYLVKDVYGVYHRGTWGFDDDDEDWYTGEIVPTELETLIEEERSDGTPC